MTRLLLAVSLVILLSLSVSTAWARVDELVLTFFLGMKDGSENSEGVVVTFTVEEGEESQLKILLVAARHEVIESRVQIADAAEVQYAALGVDSLALADGGPENEPEEDTRSPSVLTLSAAGGEVKRGSPLQVSGQVEADGVGCEGARVDVALRSESGVWHPLGSLPTVEEGRYEGAVTVSLDLAVGDYTLGVSTPGNATCGPGRSE